MADLLELHDLILQHLRSAALPDDLLEAVQRGLEKAAKGNSLVSSRLSSLVACKGQAGLSNGHQADGSSKIVSKTGTKEKDMQSRKGEVFG